MFWVPLAMAAMGAVQGKKRAEREADIESQSRKMRAAEQQYSPWTGRTSFTPVQYATTGAGDAMMSGALAGGLSGASLGNALGGAFSSGPTQAPTTGTLDSGNAFSKPGFWEDQMKMQKQFGGGSLFA